MKNSIKRDIFNSKTNKEKIKHLDAQRALMTRTLEIRYAEASGATAKPIMTEMSPAGFQSLQYLEEDELLGSLLPV